MFTRQCMVQKYITRPHGRCYVLYVDFQRAFDCLVHYKLVSNMISKGANGNLIRLLMSMYEKLENYVRIPYSPLHLNRRENSMSRDKIAGPFRCNIGTRQGDLSSPIIFSLYINDLVSHLRQNVSRCFITNDIPDSLCSLLDDDVACGADTVSNLQLQLSAISDI